MTNVIDKTCHLPGVLRFCQESLLCFLGCSLPRPFAVISPLCCLFRMFCVPSKFCIGYLPTSRPLRISYYLTFLPQLDFLNLLNLLLLITSLGFSSLPPAFLRLGPLNHPSLFLILCSWSCQMFQTLQQLLALCMELVWGYDRVVMHYNELGDSTHGHVLAEPHFRVPSFPVIFTIFFSNSRRGLFFIFSS